jgi:hypothetical protein
MAFVFKYLNSPTRKQFNKAFKDLRIKDRAKTDRASAPIIIEWHMRRDNREMVGTLHDFLINKWVDQRMLYGNGITAEDWLRQELSL